MSKCFRPCQTLPTELCFDSHHRSTENVNHGNSSALWAPPVHEQRICCYFFILVLFSVIVPCPFWQVNTILHSRDLWKSILSPPDQHNFFFPIVIMSLNWMKKMIMKWKMAMILMWPTWDNPQVSIDCGFRNWYEMTDMMNWWRERPFLEGK